MRPTTYAEQRRKTVKILAPVGVFSLVVLLSVGMADAAKENARATADQEVTGLQPGLESSTSCDYTCTET